MQERASILRRLFFVGGLVIGALLFSLLVYKIGPGEVWANLLAFGLFHLILFIGISLLNFCLYTWRWQIILKTMTPGRLAIPFHRLFLHRMSGFAAGYLTPAAQVAGEPVRVAMLRGEGLSFQVATGSVVLDLAFEITAFVLYVSLGLIFALMSGLEAFSGLQLFWSGGFIGALIVFLGIFFINIIMGGGLPSKIFRVFGLRRFAVIARFDTWLKGTEHIMSTFFTKRYPIIFFVMMLSLLMAAFKAIEAVILAYFFGVNLHVADAFLMSTLPGIALLLPIPGGLGVFEGSNAAMFALLSLPLNPVAYTMIIRLRDFLFIAIGVSHAVISGEKLIEPYVAD